MTAGTCGWATRRSDWEAWPWRPTRSISPSHPKAAPRSTTPVGSLPTARPPAWNAAGSAGGGRGDTGFFPDPLQSLPAARDVRRDDVEGRGATKPFVDRLVLDLPAATGHQLGHFMIARSAQNIIDRAVDDDRHRTGELSRHRHS